MREAFFIGPFGIKPAHPEHGIETIDFNKLYEEVLRPAAQKAGLHASRADGDFSTESVLESVVAALLRADVVVADVTLPNANVYYELGIRHTLSNGPTVLVAHEGTKFPFDIAHRRVLSYSLKAPQGLGERLVATLRSALSLQGEEHDVRRVLRRAGFATRPEDGVGFEQDLRARIERAENKNQLLAIWYWARSFPRLPIYPLTQLAKALQQNDIWDVAAEILERLVSERPDDFELRRKFGWNLRKLKRVEEAEENLAVAIRLNPSDPEARGLMGGLLKAQKRYEEAANQYARGAAVAPGDTYMLVNLAGLEILKSPDAPEAALAHYRDLLGLLERVPVVNHDVWTELMLGEAHFALGNDEESLRAYRTAAARSGVEQALASETKQLEAFAEARFRSTQARTCIAALAERHAERLGVRALTPEPVATFPIILHLSDLHFGTNPESKTSMHRFKKGDWEKTLVEHLSREFHPKSGHFKIDRERLFVVVSGDLTYTGGKVEFELVHAFLSELCSSFGIDRTRVVIAPGNHDVNWNLAKNDLAQRFDNFLLFVDRFYGRRAADLYPGIEWPLKLGVSPEAKDLFAVFDDAASGLQFVALNSCVHEDNERHWGFMGGRQLERISEVLLERQFQPKLRVAVFHHHLHPYPEPPSTSDPWVDLSVIRDGALFERWLERSGFDLALHGHKHKPQLRETVIRGADGGAADKVAAPLIVCGAGSASVNGKELEQDVPNQYQVIEVLRAPRARSADFLRVEWRQLAATAGAEWVTPRSWVLSG
jgi:3',5'-cyclic AMP phosphodiesterase CpdA/Flp pilus assembly protein TadD